MHRFYLRGFGDLWAWLHGLPTLAGFVGFMRMRDFGQDDRLSWVLLPVLGLMIAQAMLHAIVYGLTPDAEWAARYNPNGPVAETRWGPIFGVVLALLIGATVLMGTIAFSGQKLFETLQEDAQVSSQSPK
jgi:uncharacterized membrane protein